MTAPRSEADDTLCPPRLIDGEYFACGRSVLNRDPHARREDGCPGATFICVHCADDYMGFIRRAQDARAVRQEHKAD